MSTEPRQKNLFSMLFQRPENGRFTSPQRVCLPDSVWTLRADTSQVRPSRMASIGCCCVRRTDKERLKFSIVVGAGLALTPPMGWNRWNAWDRSVDEDKIRSAAYGFVKTGLAARGYSYVNIDSCWQGRRSGKYNAIQPNRKFTDMGASPCAISGNVVKRGDSVNGSSFRYRPTGRNS
jgi:hypothetical protein